MSEQMMEYPRIYSNSIEPVEITKDKKTFKKRYFKMFLMNNRKTLPTLSGNEAVTWSVKNTESLDSDIESFTNVSIVDEDEDHFDPTSEGIDESNYNNPYNYVSDVIRFHQNHGVAKVTRVYKPDSNLLNAALQDENIIVTYKALGETIDPDTVKDPIRKQKIIRFNEKLDQMEKQGKDLYVSPGIYSLDDERNGNDVIVKRFAATHVAVVANPAHTKPIAYIHKETCKIDGNTCYIKLFNASELVKLNNNSHQNKDMADPSQIATGVADLETDEFGNRIETEVTDPSGNTHTEVSKTQTKITTPEDKKKEVEKKVAKKEAEKPKDKTLEDFDSTSKKSKKADDEDSNDDKDGYIKKSDLDAYFAKKQADLLKAVDERQEQKLESVRKINIVNSFISKDAEDLSDDYEFYSNLPVSSEQLSKILKDSRFNNEDKKETRKKHDFIASTTDIDGSSYSNADEDRGSSTVDGEISFSSLYCGDDIPDRFK